MKVWGISDLHLDINPLRGPVEKHPEDILLIAGDTAEERSFYPRMHTFDGNPKNITRDNIVLTPTKVDEDFREICAAYKHVVKIVGNHEFYNGHIWATVVQLKEYFEDVKNLTILDNTTITFYDEGLRVIGTTLWTDMRRSNAEVMYACQHSMNDYNLIWTDSIIGKIPNPHGVRIDPLTTVNLHQEARKFVQHELDIITEDDPLVTVVMTHHAPVMSHANPQRTGGSIVDFAYACTDMDEMILDNAHKVALWFHGHTHDKKVTEIGQTAIATNARGYDIREFAPALLLDLDPE